MTKKIKLDQSQIKEIILIISSFIIGGIVMLAIVRFTPLMSDIIGDRKGSIITKNGTKVFEKSSLAGSVEKIYDAVVVVQNYSKGSLSETGTGFIYKVDDKYGYIADGIDLGYYITNNIIIETMHALKTNLIEEIFV